MANSAVVRRKDVLAQAAEIINTKAKTLDEKDSKFVRRLKTKGFSPIAVFQTQKFYRILNEFDFFHFENLDREGRTPGSWQFNVKLSTAISFAVVALAVIVITGLVGAAVKGIQWPLLAATALAISHICYRFNSDSKKENFWIILSSGVFFTSGFQQIAPENAKLLASIGIVAAYVFCTVVIFITANILPIHQRCCGYLATQINSRLPMEKLIRKLFPYQQDSGDHEDLRVKLHFNTDEVFEKTKRKLWSVGYKPCIASVVGGIAVDRDDLRGIYTEREHDFPSAHDPILYLVSADGTEVAVMARSGNFPDEKALLAFAEKL